MLQYHGLISKIRYHFGFGNAVIWILVMRLSRRKRMID